MKCFPHDSSDAPEEQENLTAAFCSHLSGLGGENKTPLQRQSPAAAVPSFFKVRKSDLLLEFSLYQHFLLIPHLVDEDPRQNSSTKGGKKKIEQWTEVHSGASPLLKKSAVNDGVRHFSPSSSSRLLSAGLSHDTRFSCGPGGKSQHPVVGGKWKCC